MSDIKGFGGTNGRFATKSQQCCKMLYWDIDFVIE